MWLMKVLGGGGGGEIHKSSMPDEWQREGENSWIFQRQWVLSSSSKHTLVKFYPQIKKSADPLKSTDGSQVRSPNLEGCGLETRHRRQGEGLKP